MPNEHSRENEWEERFEQKLAGPWRSMDEVKDFIRTEIAAAEKRKVAEIVEKVQEFYEHNKGDEYGLNQDFSDGWDAGLKSLLKILLQADNNTYE